MPTIFTHAAFTAIIGSSPVSNRRSRVLIAAAAFCSIVPDFDIVAFYIGIPYSNMLGHRGFTHSIVFAVALGAVAAAIARRLMGTGEAFGRTWLIFSAATVSHPLLDMLTNGGLGVALLAPFSNERFFLPWRPVEVSPIGAGFFSGEGLTVVMSELVWIWLPAIVFWLAVMAVRSFGRR